MADDYEQVKRQVAEIERQTSEAIGVEKQLARELRREYGIKPTEKSVKAMIRQKEAEERAIAVEWTKKFKKFKKRHKKRLEGL